MKARVSVPSKIVRDRVRLKRSFRDFAHAFWPIVTGNEYVANSITKAIIAALQRVGNGEVAMLILACPPGVGKSTLLVLFHAWRIARDPGWRAMTVSHTYELAGTTSRRVRRLVESSEFQALFQVNLRDDASTIALWETASNGHFLAVGRDSGVTGRRVNEIICDDLHAAADRYSRAELERTWVFFNETLSTRLDNDRAALVVCGQRIAPDDVSGRLQEHHGWTVVAIPAELDDGTPLAPNVLPREKLDAIKAQLGAAAYATQYLQRPADDASAPAKRSWWRFHRSGGVPATAPRPAGCDIEHLAVETPTKFDQVVLAVDMTFGTTTSAADYAVAQVWGSVGGDRFLLAQWRARATQMQQRAAIKRLVAEWKPRRILVEKAAGGAGAVEILTADGIANVIAVTTGGKGKRERFDLVSPAIEGGHAHLPLGAAWLSDFVEELAGATKHDDSLDATAYALGDLATASNAAYELKRRHQAMLRALDALWANPWLRRVGPKRNPDGSLS
jgi:predicted phage terminase large subunit-like protein